MCPALSITCAASADSTVGVFMNEVRYANWNDSRKEMADITYQLIHVHKERLSSRPTLINKLNKRSKRRK